MSIPQVLAIDLNYGIDKSELEKTINLNLNINKDKFSELNNERVKNNEKEITLQDIQKIIVKGNVKYEDNSFNFIIEPKENEKELYQLIKPLIEIDIDYFKCNSTEFIHLSPQFNHLMEKKDFDRITNDYFNPIRKNLMKRNLSKTHFDEIESGKNQYSIVFKTLLNEPLKQVNNVFLPSLNQYKDSLFYNEKISVDNSEYYKYVSYIPENYFWDIPTTMKNENIKINNVNFKIRYLNMDEIVSNNLEYLLEDTEYINNLNKEVLNETIKINQDKPYEISWSNENLKQTNSLVEINEFPKLLTNELNEIVITKPNQVKTKLLKLFFGINHEYFNKKVTVNSMIETPQAN